MKKTTKDDRLKLKNDIRNLKNKEKLNEREKEKLAFLQFGDSLIEGLRKGQKKPFIKKEEFFFYIFVVIFALLVNLIIHLLRT